MLKNSRFYVLFYIPGVDGADGAAKTKQFFLTYFFSRASFSEGKKRSTNVTASRYCYFRKGIISHEMFPLCSHLLLLLLKSLLYSSSLTQLSRRIQ